MFGLRIFFARRPDLGPRYVHRKWVQKAIVDIFTQIWDVNDRFLHPFSVYVPWTQNPKRLLL
jgi:hypothetical protein